MITAPSPGEHGVVNGAFPLDTTRPFGFNVIGYVSGNLGLGVSARNIVQALLDNDLPVAVLDVDPGLGRGSHDRRYEALAVVSADELPYAINLLIFPPPTLVAFVPEYRALLCRPDCFNAAFTWWELPVIPPAWLPALEFFDVLVAPSGFIRHTLDVGLRHAMTLAARHPLYLPRQTTSDRKRFEIEPDDLVLVTSFELSSDPVRKNVVAAVEAFKAGLANVSEARLLIKVNNAGDASPRNRTLAWLRDVSAADRRVRIVTEELSYAEVLCLYASSDVFVSLHRSEGLGLGAMEAMGLGKAVIATAWSGNMEYMNHTNACLVPYSLVSLTNRTGPYSARALGGVAAHWAEPNVDEAAAWMKRLAGDSELRVALGERAAQAIAAYHDEAVKTGFAHEIRALWEHRYHTGHLPDRTERLSRVLAASVGAETPAVRAIAKARRVASQALDRHVLWRFRH